MFTAFLIMTISVELDDMVSVTSIVRWQSYPSQSELSKIVPPSLDHLAVVDLVCDLAPNGSVKKCVPEDVHENKSVIDAALKAVPLYKLSTKSFFSSLAPPIIRFSVIFRNGADGHVLKRTKCIPPVCVRHDNYQN